MMVRNHRVTNNLEGEDFEGPVAALTAWDPTLRAINAAAEEDNSISIFDTIGAGIFSEGVTLKRIDAALRQMGPRRDIVVNINSPGGLMFEGIAIHNRLRQHRGAIRVNVLGLAASAASVIAMAGDEIVMNRGAQMMIHNPMSIALGDHRDFEEAARTLKGFRDSLLDIYSAKTGIDRPGLIKMLDNETWLNDKSALDRGFATSIEDLPVRREDPPRNLSKASAFEVVKVALAKEGLTRKERAELFKRLGLAASVTDEPETAAASVTGDTEGAAKLADSLSKLIQTLKG